MRYRDRMAQVDQPYAFLIDSIKDRERHIQRAQALIDQLREQLRCIQQVGLLEESRIDGHSE